jgi:thiamine pyrophosphate-dependent acetolactate synthase large subunit-like protein
MSRTFFASSSAEAARDEITYIIALQEYSALGIAAGSAEATGQPAF